MKYIIILIFILGCWTMVLGQNSRIWATYYGGDKYEEGHSVATDKSGNVYLAGTTWSTNNITANGFQNIYGGGLYGDAFLVKFDSSGNRLWATYYGGSGNDYGFDVATDRFGNVYLAGTTENSLDSIASGGFQNNYGGSTSDAYLVKFDSSGNRLWATYYGGGGSEHGLNVITDSFGNVYLAGVTLSHFNIASGGFQNNIAGSWDVFLVKFDEGGNRLWATYYGGADIDNVHDLAIDSYDNIYLGGTTLSNNGIASNGYQNNNGGGYDAFLVKFNSDGNRLWATYYGGSGDESGGFRSCGIATDGENNIYLTGDTESLDGIAYGGFQNTYNGGDAFFKDAFLVKFDSSGNRIWATYYGGTKGDTGNKIAVDSSANIYLIGTTRSTTGLAHNGFQNVHRGGICNQFEVYLTKFNSSGSPICASYFGGAGDDKGLNVTLDKWGSIYIVGNTTSHNYIASGGFQNSLTIGTGSDAFLAKFTPCDNCQFLSEINLTQNGDTIFATQASNYSWYHNDTLISGATAQTYVISSSGNYYVISYEDSCRIISNIIETSCECTGLEESDFSSNIKIYPNPANSSITIEHSLPQSMLNKRWVITVFDVTGKHLQQLSTNEYWTNSHKMTIDLSAFCQGIYFLNLFDGENNINRKIAKK